MTTGNYLVVGGSQGIGLAIAQKLQYLGAAVYNASRSGAGSGTPLQLDVLSGDFSPLDSLPESFNGVVYCPGSINLKPFGRFSQADFQKDWEVNVMGAAAVLQKMQNRLKASGAGSVVMFSTVAVQTGMSFHASIAMAKGAVEGLTRSLAAEWAPLKIRVNAIAPSLTDTPLAAALLSSPEKREASDKRHPLGRVGTADDIAAMTCFLLSQEASWITGQIIHADGGIGNLK